MRKREREALDRLIDRFLAERRESDAGGWAPVTLADIERLHIILNKIIRMKWGADPDGDRPINWQLIDRTKFEPMHYDPVPYEHQVEGAAKFERLGIVMRNARLANSELDTTLRLMQHDIQMKGKLNIEQARAKA